MSKFSSLLAASALAASLWSGAVQAQSLIISSALPQTHHWVGGHMDPFIAAMEEAAGGEVSFIPFYAGELTSVGRELDALQGGAVQVAAPLLAPYHEGLFPLSDVTQLPTYGTTSHMVTRAFQRLLDSDVALKDGKTFYEYEIGSKGIRAWAIGATPAYSISTGAKPIDKPSDFSGQPLRAGSAIHTIVVNELGATPVTMPAVSVYEALSRGTVGGLVLSISDWPAYSLEQVIKHTITDVSIGHWESYLAISEDAWKSLSPETRKLWDEAARRIALTNADVWEERVEAVKADTTKNRGASFTPIAEKSPELQAHVAAAAARSWKAWIDKLEAAGHPARETAKLYAGFILEEGGELPEGVAETLGL